jgi:hypothetical protein
VTVRVRAVVELQHTLHADHVDTMQSTDCEAAVTHENEMKQGLTRPSVLTKYEAVDLQHNMV